MKRSVCWMLMVLMCAGGVMAQEEDVVIARKAFAEKNWEKAAEFYEASIIPGKIPAQDYFNWGIALENLKRYEDAKKPFKYVLNNTEEGDPLRNRATVHIAMCFGFEGDEALTMDWLLRAEKAGVKAQAFFASHPAFGFLKGNTAFQALLERQKPCTGPEYRQFDFWIGDWNVFDPQGNQVGTNTITPVAESCGLREEWVSASGIAGTSINFYDQKKGQWHQTWIGGDGNPLYLEGGMVEGSMVIGDGTNRITYTPNEDGTVRQHWEVTQDEGKTWSTAFDGLYKKNRP